MKPPIAALCRVNAGWTLVELSIGMAIVGILASLSYPSFMSAICRIHRNEAITRLAQVHLQQQRHRSNHPSFATLAELGVATTIAGGRYRLQEQVPTASGFFVMAKAQGPQIADLICSHLLLEVAGADVRQASGPDADVGNDGSDNRRCWGQ